jgi:hypothetical protein
MFDSAKILSISPILETVANALNNHESFSLVLTGHSLGAGCAALLAMLWSRRIKKSDDSFEFMTDTSKGFPLRPIKCYVYVYFIFDTGVSRNNECGVI